MSARNATTAAAADFLHAIVSLGANLPTRSGSREQTLRQALHRLRQLGSGACRVSSLYRTAPLDCPPGTPDFLNALVVLEVDAATDPASLLRQLHAIELDYGRRRHGAGNESRTLDLDLIALGGQVCRQADLVLPHPRAHQRRFVLEPLAELWPELILPTQSASVGELLAALPEQPWCHKLSTLDG